MGFSPIGERREIRGFNRDDVNRTHSLAIGYGVDNFRI